VWLRQQRNLQQTPPAALRLLQCFLERGSNFSGAVTLTLSYCLHCLHAAYTFSVAVLQGSVYCVPANMSTLEALSQMARDHKSSLGVTDPANGQLISNLSVSDLRCGLEIVIGFKGFWGRRY
jgi:hypothetical protein